MKKKAICKYMKEALHIIYLDPERTVRLCLIIFVMPRDAVWLRYPSFTQLPLVNATNLF